MKRLLLLFCLTLMLPLACALIQGCCKETDENTFCLGPGGFKITALDNSDSTIHEPVNNTIKAKALVLYITFRDSGIDCAWNRNALPFLSNATATKCGPGFKVIKHVKNYRVYTAENWDASHPAGTDLKLLFRHGDAVDDRSNYHTAALYLAYPPTNSGTYHFTVYADLDTGETIRMDCEPINLKL